MTRHRCTLALFAMAQVTDVDHANALYLNEIFCFLKITFNVPGCEICSVNNKQFRFEHYSAGQKQRNMVPLAIFTKKKELRIGHSCLEDMFQLLFNRSPKSEKKILAFWSDNSNAKYKKGSLQ